MKRRTQRAVIIAYLATISTIAPVAFLIGSANGSNRPTSSSQNGTDSEMASSAPYALLSTLDGCALLGPSGTMSRNWAEIDCLPLDGGQSRADARRKTAIGFRNRQRTPLDTAFAAAIATNTPTGRVGAGSDADAIARAFSLALAPTITAQGGSRLGGPTTPTGGGLPNILAPLIGLGGDGLTPPGDTPPIDDIPDLVTPIPAALPLLLTGLAGLLAATRRKRNISDHSQSPRSIVSKISGDPN